jgi:hypothetical protein
MAGLLFRALSGPLGCVLRFSARYQTNPHLDRHFSCGAHRLRLNLLRYCPCAPHAPDRFSASCACRSGRSAGRASGSVRPAQRDHAGVPSAALRGAQPFFASRPPPPLGTRSLRTSPIAQTCSFRSRVSCRLPQGLRRRTHCRAQGTCPFELLPARAAA